MKKSVSFFLICVLMLCIMPSCAGKSKSVIEINGTTQVNSEIFTYFLDKLYYENPGLSEDEYIEQATSECLKYIAVNTRFAQMGQSFTPREKADISALTNALWRLYGDYYTEIGVSRNTFFKIMQYDCSKEKLQLVLYDKNGTKPLNEEYIKQYFTANYVGIKYFYQELYTVLSDNEYNALTEYEKNAYNESKKAAEERYKFISTVANYVNSSVYTMDEAFMAVTGEVSADISVSAEVVSKKGSSFSGEFVDAVFKQSAGSAFIITNSEKSNVYFIERIDLLDSSYGFYEEYRTQCLLAVSESFFINEINSWIQSYTAVRHLSVARQCFDSVTNVDRSKYAGTENYKFESFLPRNSEDIK